MYNEYFFIFRSFIENYNSYILSFYFDLLSDFSNIDLSFLNGCYK